MDSKICEELLDELETLIVEISEKTDISNEIKRRFSTSFKRLYHQSHSDNFYWRFCSSKVFIDNIPDLENEYESYLNEYRMKYPDGPEPEFLESLIQELTDSFWSSEFGDVKVFSNIIYWSGVTKDRNLRVDISDFLDGETFQNVNWSQTSKLDYALNLRSEKKGSHDHLDRKMKNTNSRLEWRGTNVELVEIIKSLILLNKFDPDLSEKEIYNRFFSFLNVSIDTRKSIENIRLRSKRGGELTFFLAKMSIALEQWNDKLEENQTKM